jgi:hypothetical protein
VVNLKEFFNESLHGDGSSIDDMEVVGKMTIIPSRKI